MSFVVTPITTATANNGGSTSVTTSSFNVGAGTLVCVAGLDALSAGGPLVVVDSLANSYTQSLHPASVGATGELGNYSFYYPNAETGLTITATHTGTVQGYGISVFKITGSTGVEDTAVPAGAAGSASEFPSVTSANNSSQSGEIFLGLAAWFGGATFTQAVGWSTAFSSLTFTGPGAVTWAMNGGYLVVPTITSETYDPTLSSNSTWGAFIDAFEGLNFLDPVSCSLFVLP